MTHTYVRDIMTADVVAVEVGASYLEIAALLRTHRISGLPVVDADRKVVGMVSEADLLAAGTRPGTGAQVPAPRPGRPAWRLQHTAPRAAGPTAADLMARPVVVIGPDEPASTAARLMSGRRLRRLPVVDRHGHLMGILCRADVLSVFTRPDEQIRREVTQDVIAEGFFLDPALFTVTVTDGIVTLAGPIGSVLLGRNIADQVGHVEGVVAVRDRFTYPVPAQLNLSTQAHEGGHS
jgi:CBS-domain-containing membrane protein